MSLVTSAAAALVRAVRTCSLFVGFCGDTLGLGAFKFGFRSNVIVVSTLSVKIAEIYIQD